MKDINVLLAQYRKTKRNQIAHKKNEPKLRFCTQLFPGGLRVNNPPRASVKEIKIIPKPLRKPVCTPANTNCPICFSIANAGAVKAEVLLCGHLFHSKCINEWKSHSKNCPLCRAEM